MQLVSTLQKLVFQIYISILFDNITADTSDLLVTDMENCCSCSLIRIQTHHTIHLVNYLSP